MRSFDEMDRIMAKQGKEIAKLAAQNTSAFDAVLAYIDWGIHRATHLKDNFMRTMNKFLDEHPEYSENKQMYVLLKLVEVDSQRGDRTNPVGKVIDVGTEQAMKDRAKRFADSYGITYLQWKPSIYSVGNIYGFGYYDEEYGGMDFMLIPVDIKN